MEKYRKDKVQHIELEYDLLNSAAWTALSYEAQWVYIELKKQWNFKQGGDKHLVLCYSQVSWRMAENTFWKKIIELVEYGFIKRVLPGGIYKNPTVFALSERWRKKNIEIVDKEGRGAIEQGLAKKRTHKSYVSSNAAKFWEKKKKASKSGIKR